MVFLVSLCCSLVVLLVFVPLCLTAVSAEAFSLEGFAADPVGCITRSAKTLTALLEGLDYEGSFTYVFQNALLGFPYLDSWDAFFTHRESLSLSMVLWDLFEGGVASLVGYLICRFNVLWSKAKKAFSPKEEPVKKEPAKKDPEKDPVKEDPVLARGCDLMIWTTMLIAFVMGNCLALFSSKALSALLSPFLHPFIALAGGLGSFLILSLLLWINRRDLSFHKILLHGARNNLEDVYKLLAVWGACRIFFATDGWSPQARALLGAWLIPALCVFIILVSVLQDKKATSG